MTKVFIEESHALPLVSVAVSFRSGAAYDPEGRSGLARVTARMLRRGSDALSADDIEERIDALGGDVATDTSVSASSLHFEVIRRSLEPFSDLVATLLARPTFPKHELDRLVRESQAELVEARDSDRSLAARALRRTLFEGHPYGRRVSGTTPTLAAITRSDIETLYRQHFTRANAVVAIAGDVTQAEGFALADKLLAGLPEGEPVPDSVPPPVVRTGRRLVLVDKPDRTQTQMVIGGLGTDVRDADHVAMLVAVLVFGGTFTSRMMQEIRAKRGWSYGAYARAGVDRQREAFTMWTAPATGDAAACLALQLELLRAFRADGLTEDELAFVKKYLVRSHAFDIDTARKRVHQKLEAAVYDLPAGYHERYVEHVLAVDRASANQAVRLRVPEEDLVVAVVATNADVGESLAKAIPGLSEVIVLPFDFE